MSLLAWYLVMFVPQLLIGAALGWWTARRSDPSEAASADAQRAAEEINNQEEALRHAMDALQQLTSSVQDEVREHSSKVDSSSKALSALAGDQESGPALEAIAPILKANEQLQQKLAEAEQKLAEQTEQLNEQSLQARTDPLTGVLNRRGLDEKFAELMERSLADEQPLSVIVLDVDHFKKFNDKYGHDVGDLVLREVARVASGAVRTNDVVGRYGGEEFVVLMPKTALHQARQVAENVRTAIENHTVDGESGELKVTVSLGVAQAGAEDGAALMKRADQALYAAKENGRNCSWCHDGLNCVPIARKAPASTEDGRSDELTQLPSRRAFAEEAARRLAETARFGSDLSVIALEIDQIEELKQTAGQETVNLVLRGMARFLSDLMRDTDLVARNGETGFMILLPACATPDAVRVAERIRSAVANSPFPAEKELHLTVSVGVAGAAPVESVEALLENAERALGWCRKANGNCIHVDEADETAEADSGSPPVESVGDAAPPAVPESTDWKVDETADSETGATADSAPTESSHLADSPAAPEPVAAS